MNLKECTPGTRVVTSGKRGTVKSQGLRLVRVQFDNGSKGDYHPGNLNPESVMYPPNQSEVMPNAGTI